ncbi:MAG: hypothetical protein OHM57_05690 [Spiroplasma phoeniceum]|nr:MAG: hypothetical protein OHM57_05690 [Spiroplasma phoeniceum]
MVVRKRLRFWYKKYFFTIIDELKTLDFLRYLVLLLKYYYKI